MKLPDDFISLCICLPLAAEPGVLLGSIGTVCKFQQNTEPIPFLYGRNRIHFKFHIFFKVEFLHPVIPPSLSAPEQTYRS